MKINKLIKDINNYYLKMLMKKEQVFYQIEDDYILLSDKYIIAILKRDELYLNINLMKQSDLLVKYIKELNDEYYTNIASKLCDKKFTYLYNGDNKITINRKYDKLFDGLEIKAIGDIQPVLFYVNKELRGFVLPVKIY